MSPSLCFCWLGMFPLSFYQWQSLLYAFPQAWNRIILCSCLTLLQSPYPSFQIVAVYRISFWSLQLNKLSRRRVLQETQLCRWVSGRAYWGLKSHKWQGIKKPGVKNWDEGFSFHHSLHFESFIQDLTSHI